MIESKQAAVATGSSSSTGKLLIFFIPWLVKALCIVVLKFTKSLDLCMFLGCKRLSLHCFDRAGLSKVLVGDKHLEPF